MRLVKSKMHKRANAPVCFVVKTLITKVVITVKIKMVFCLFLNRVLCSSGAG